MKILRRKLASVLWSIGHKFEQRKDRKLKKEKTSLGVKFIKISHSIRPKEALTPQNTRARRVSQKEETDLGR